MRRLLLCLCVAAGANGLTVPAAKRDVAGKADGGVESVLENDDSLRDHGSKHGSAHASSRLSIRYLFGSSRSSQSSGSGSVDVPAPAEPSDRPRLARSLTWRATPPGPPKEPSSS